MSLIRWFIRNPVAANLIMLLIIIAGIFTMTSMRIEGFPKLPADSIQIDTIFIDAYTEQVDRQITQKIEKALEGLPGIKKIQSTSLDGFSSILVQKNPGYSLQQLQDDVRVRLDGIYNFPQAADKPVITRNDFDFPALIVQLYGDSDPDTLQRLGRELREALLAQPEISKLNLWGERKPELRIEVRPEILEKYDLTTRDIAEKIQQSSLTFKAGSLKTEGARIALRADSQRYYYRDFVGIPIYQHSDGSQLLLGDVAEVHDSYEDDDVIVRFNGQPALGMEVLIGRTENLLDIADVVKKTVANFQKVLPAEVKLSVWADASHYISDRLGLLKNNALQGLFLVFILLALFLNLKLAFWVAMGIPISIAGAMAVLGSQWMDYSLNDITTFGFIIALGILVDDAVVVGESVFEERKHYRNVIEGTERGVQRVAMATIFGVLTTVAALSPLMLIDSAMGKIMASFSGVVILTLLFSLFESKFILPAHLTRISLEKKRTPSWLLRLWHRLQDFVQQQLDRLIQKIYKPLLGWSLNQRYAILVLFIAVAALGMGLIGKGQIKTVFFPDIPEQVLSVSMEMDARAPYQLTLENANRIEDVANTLNEEWLERFNLDEKPIKHILMVVSGAFMVEVYAELTPPSKHLGLETLDILQQWQGRVGHLEGTTELVFSATEGAAGGFAIDLYSKDEERLRAASQELLAYLEDINGVSNLRDELKNGKPELYLKLKSEARHLGFSNETLASQIGESFGGAEAQRLQRGRQEVRVIVKSRETSRDTIADLMQLRLKSDNGQWFPLTAVAIIESAYVTDYIARRDGKRVNTIRASINKNKVAPSEIAQQLSSSVIPDLENRFPEVTVSQAGELEEMASLKGSLIKALIFTCILIYVLLAIPLKSYWQPFIIMSVIPFGFIGAAIGHLIMGLPLSFLSFLGMLALAGVVVNDSLVLMTRYNQNREEGSSVHDALMSAGSGRFRAIFLTTVTTVAGLMPLMRETSEQAQYLIPAAVSLAYGEIFATAITLMLVPVLIAIGVDIQLVFRKTLNLKTT
ncbi:MAG: efflux RND transporter permease subunit [Gammaproteobacteria bacterium]|nr:efflux RND transporter permease subunit [Gammaproteobacteria bacterium]